jgi:hypothetical protein
MKNLNHSLIFLVAVISILFSSCENFVNNISDPINIVADDKLNTPDGAEFLAKGIEAKFVSVHGQMILYAGGLSDELIFIQGSYEPWDAIDKAQITGLNPLVPQNTWLEPMMSEVAVLLYLSDSLVVRTKNYINFSNSEKDISIRNRALLIGYFYGAASRFYWAAYWGLDPTNPNDKGGGVINLSSYIPAAQMYEDALKHLDSAYNYADEIHKKYINTFKARIYLYTGNYVQAKQSTESGLLPGDIPLQALYTSTNSNYWSQYAGPFYPNYFADFRFGKYIEDNPEESARIPLAEWKFDDGSKGLLQGKYSGWTDPISFLTWQENLLMKAELAIREGDKSGGLNLVNQIRANYNISALTDSKIQSDFKGNYLDMIYQERDKELCFMGIRLNDQRRCDKWHLDKSSTWQFLPISETERRMNPNLR